MAEMHVTLTANGNRHWVTHNANGLNYTACGKPFGNYTFPPVLMPSACVDCARCASQLEAFEMSQLNGDIPMHIPSTRNFEIEG